VTQRVSAPGSKLLSTAAPFYDNIHQFIKHSAPRPYLEESQAGAPEQPRSVSDGGSAVNKREKRCVKPSTTVKIGTATVNNGVCRWRAVVEGGKRKPGRSVNKQSLSASHAVNKQRLTQNLLARPSATAAW